MKALWLLALLGIAARPVSAAGALLSRPAAEAWRTSLRAVSSGMDAPARASLDSLLRLDFSQPSSLRQFGLLISDIEGNKRVKAEAAKAGVTEAAIFARLAADPGGSRSMGVIAGKAVKERSAAANEEARLILKDKDALWRRLREAAGAWTAEAQERLAREARALSARADALLSRHAFLSPSHRQALASEMPDISRAAKDLAMRRPLAWLEDAKGRLRFEEAGKGAEVWKEPAEDESWREEGTSVEGEWRERKPSLERPGFDEVEEGHFVANPQVEGENKAHKLFLGVEEHLRFLSENGHGVDFWGVADQLFAAFAAHMEAEFESISAMGLGPASEARIESLKQQIPQLAGAVTHLARAGGKAIESQGRLSSYAHSKRVADNTMRGYSEERYYTKDFYGAEGARDTLLQRVYTFESAWREPLVRRQRLAYAQSTWARNMAPGDSRRVHALLNVFDYYKDVEYAAHVKGELAFMRQVLGLFDKGFVAGALTWKELKREWMLGMDGARGMLRRAKIGAALLFAGVALIGLVLGAQGHVLSFGAGLLTIIVLPVSFFFAVSLVLRSWTAARRYLRLRGEFERVDARLGFLRGWVKRWG